MPVVLTPAIDVASVVITPLTTELDSVGAVVKETWLVAVPSVWPLPAANVRTPPTSRLKLANVRPTDPPLPAVVCTVELPAPRARMPTASVDAAPAAPT